MAGIMLQMLTYFYGVGGAGKDVVIGLCTALMGMGRRNYARVLKKGYFLKESSPESIDVHTLASTQPADFWNCGGRFVSTLPE
jgi:hypothetical protein